jgi:myosin heavy subunit
MKPQTTTILTLALAAFLIGCAPEATSQSEPGKRPDLKPSSLEFWSSLESKTLDQIRRVKAKEEELAAAREQREELQKQQTTAKEGPWWSPFEDEKEKVTREVETLTRKIDKLEEEKEVAGSQLQDLLSSTPSGRTSPEAELRDYRLNKEATEIRNALENLTAMGNRLVEEIRRNPKDTKKAVECYDTQMRALGYVQLMHSEFVRRTLEEYPRYLDDLQRACREFQQKQREALAAFKGKPEDADIIARTIDKAAELEGYIPTLRSNIVEMRRWAERNLETVRNKKVVLASLRDSAALYDRAKDIASSINAAFGELEFEEPPLVEFEIDPEALDLEIGGPGGIE